MAQFESTYPLNVGLQNALVDRVRQGDREAMARLIECHRAAVIHVAANVLRDRTEAEDVAQEAFLKVFEQISKLREDRGFRNYLFQTAMRLCLDRLRKKKPELRESVELTDCHREQISTKLDVEFLLNQMNPNLRAILVLREIEQLDYEEIALYLRIPVGTVRSRLHTARERFRVLWLEYHSEGAC